MHLVKKASGAVAALSLVLGLVGPIAAIAAPTASVQAAATTPSLGAASTFAVLASTYTNTVPGSTINGDLGYVTGPAVNPTVNGTTHINDGVYTQAGTDRASALVALNAQACDFNFGAATDLSLLPQPLGPGVYCITGAASIGAGGITLSGSGTYIFRVTGAISTAANSNVSLLGASACDVFWTPSAATTLGANSTFAGTAISDAGVTVGASTTWSGRSLAFGGTVTTDTDVITTACAAAPIPSTPVKEGRINVVKTVINDNGRTKTVADFSLFVNGVPVTSGDTNIFVTTGQVFTITETPDPLYTQSFSGDCDSDGTTNLNPGDYRLCVVTNNDIGAPVVVPPVPPLIDVVKVPSPLSLPFGPGMVQYTYTVRNIGTVPMTNVTMVGDTCSPIVRVSGDSNGNSILEVSETWVYTCSSMLSETHTNTVVASGWANGLNAVDVASATVIVGAPLVPPLIHVTKVPSPLTLVAGGGMVTYSVKVTNPGTVPVSNVTLTDDKCAPMQYLSGDVDADAQLDTNETWNYSCKKNVTQTTTNTASVDGFANGFTVRDFAVAPVIVATAVPALPSTGFAPAQITMLLALLATSGVTCLLLLYSINRKQTI